MERFRDCDRKIHTMENLGNTEENRIEERKKYTYDEAVELTGHGYYNYLLLITCSLIAHACALDMFGYAAVVAAASCDLNLNFTQLGFLASAPFAGVIFAFPWGYYADTRGRRRAMLLSTSVGFVFAVICAFSTHWVFMLIIKIIGSSFSTASFTLALTLLGECTGSRHRSNCLFIANSLNLASELTSFTLAWLILPLKFEVPLPFLYTSFKPWRLYAIVLAIPLGIGVALSLFLYESPKFLASKADFTNALEVLRNIYERNGGKKENYPVKYLTQTESETCSKTQSFWENLKKQTLPIFKPPLLWTTIQLFFLLSLCCTTNNTFFMWYPTMVNYFYNSLSTGNSSDQTFCQRIFGEANISPNNQTFQCNDEISPNTLYSGMLYGLFYFLVSLAVVKVASRPRLLLIGILLVSGISLLLVNLKNPIANMIFFTLLQDTSLGIGCLSSYFVDLYPTQQRGQAVGLGMMAARLCTLAGVSLIGPIITNYCEITFYAWSAFVFGGIVVCLFLPADRGIKKVLPEPSSL